MIDHKTPHLESKHWLVPWLMCGLGAFFYFYECLLRIAPSVMTADLMHNYHIGAASFSRMMAFYYFSYAPMQIIVGIFMDRFGPQRLLAFAAFICALGSYLFACSDHILIGEFGRFLVGMGSAFAFVGVLKLATIWLPPERFAIISGSAMSLGMVAGMFGDITLPILLKTNDWQHVTYYAAFLGISVGVLLVLFLRDGYKRSLRKSEQCQLSVSMEEVLANLKKLFCCPQIWINGMVGCLMWVPISVFADTWGVSYLQHAHALTHQHASHACLLVFMGWATGGPVVGYLSDHLGRRVVVMWLGALLSGLCFAAILFMPGLSYLQLCVLLFLFGFFNSPQVIIFALAREISSPRAAGTALALTNMFTMLSGFCLQPISGMLIDWLETSEEAIHTHIYSAHAYQGALSMILVSFALTIVLCIFLKESYCKQLSLVKDEG